MKVPLSWLREYVPFDLPTKDLAHQLTMSGTEVEAVHEIGSGWERVYVGRVADLSKHPRADNLYLAQVDGPDGPVTIVTAAANLRVDARVPLILAGGRLGGGQQIERRQFMGVTSEGMVCSGDELGLSLDRDRIYLLEDAAPVGAPLAEYLGDTVLDLYITPNRPDCLAVYGIAREVAAITGGQLRPLEPNPPTAVGTEVLPLEVHDLDICPRYTLALVSDLTIAPAPAWMQRRLYLSSVRPINNVVDVTNYVMLEVGQPLHAFDRDRVTGGIVVRRARPGEQITTIDDVERDLGPDVLLITDHAGPIGVAGVMGGQNSEISEGTTRLALESATFDQRNIRRTARDLRLSTEASHRFERGLDPALAPLASDRAVELLTQLAGGRIAGPMRDIYSNPEQPRTISLHQREVSALMGRSYSQDEVAGSLRSLGFRVSEASQGLEVTVPSFRRDVEGRHDLIEEVARATGYDSIPEALPSGRLPPPRLDTSRHWQNRIKETLVGAGLQEVLSYSLVDPASPFRLDSASPWPPDGTASPLIRVANPMTVEHSALRQTLLASLLETVWANLRHHDRVAVFEIARVYLPSNDELPTQPLRLALAIAGRRVDHAWNQGDDASDFFDLKGALEQVATVLHLDARFRPSAHRTFHPGRCAEMVLLDAQGTDHPVGVLGQAHPIVAERYDLPGREVYLAELDLDALAGLAQDLPTISALPRYPGVELDLAVMVEESVPQERVAAEIESAGAPLLAQLTLFDVYRGAPVPQGWRSLAYALTFRAPERTLTDEEAVAARDEIERRLAGQLGAQVRGR